MYQFRSFEQMYRPASGDLSIVQSLLDTDFYKYSMGQFIYMDPRLRDVEVTFTLIVRTKDLKLGKVIDEGELREHLDAARQLSLNEAELAFLRGIPMQSRPTMFYEKYIQFLADLKLPGYDLEYSKDGDIHLSFSGPWSKVSKWEVISMSIISELYYWSLIKKSKISLFDFQAIANIMQANLFNFVRTFQESAKGLPEDAPVATFIEMATRRRHSFIWQEFVVYFLNKYLPRHFMGTSNVKIAMMHGSANPMGTNAHELPMVYANLTNGDTDDLIRDSQYQVVKDWHKMYPELSVLLPDTFGSAQFFAGAPKEFAEMSVGARYDSKLPVPAGIEHANWLKKHGVDPMTKLGVPSDGLTARTSVDAFKQLKNVLGRVSSGIGTNLGNNCGGAWPMLEDPGFKPFSMVVKITKANGLSAVKLPDNPNKAMGEAKRVRRFKRIFGRDGVQEQAVLV